MVVPAVAGIPDIAMTTADNRRVGIALGSGGASGLAHIAMLEVLDEMGIRPTRIAGSSIGALIGGLYAAGRSGREIRKLAGKLVEIEAGGAEHRLFNRTLFRWLDLIDPDIGRGGLVDAEQILSFLYKEVEGINFEELEIPLKVVAADFWERRAVVFESGPLLPAVKASTAIPGIFVPVVHQGMTLVDGGTVNPLPYDLLMDECDIVIAVNVIGVRPGTDTEIPGYFENIFNAVKILQESIVREQMRNRRPHIYIEPPIRNIQALEFYRGTEILEQAAPAAELLRKQLTEHLEGPFG